jgi:tetratricopeptide (TPR) repeat protein
MPRDLGLRRWGLILIGIALAATADLGVPSASEENPASSGLPAEESEIDSADAPTAEGVDPIRFALLGARVQMSKGYHERADSLARARLSEFEATHGESSVPVARAISLIIENQWRSGHTEGTDGRALAARGLAILEPAAASEGHALADLLLNYASFLHEDGALGEAEATYERALSLRETLGGPNATATGKVLNSLANLYSLLGKTEKAEAALRRVAQIFRDRYGDDSKALATAYNNLGTLIGKQGRIEEAQECFERSLAIREKRLGANHIDVARVLFNLGGLSYDRGNFTDAEAQYRRGIDIQLAYAKEDKPFIAPGFENLATILAAQGRYDEAAEWLERSIATRETEADEDDPGLAGAVNSLGRLLWKAGRHAEALPHLERAYAMRVAELGPVDPGVRAPLRNLPFVTAGNPPESLTVETPSPVIVVVPLPEDATTKTTIDIRTEEGATALHASLSLVVAQRPAAFLLVEEPAVVSGRYEVDVRTPGGESQTTSFILTAPGS